MSSGDTGWLACVGGLCMSSNVPDSPHQPHLHSMTGRGGSSQGVEGETSPCTVPVSPGLDSDTRSEGGPQVGKCGLMPTHTQLRG